MAIQFPNFLSVPVTPRDYSGIGDSVENYYKGYNMPKDAIIKEIQAKFAQPNAEADLQSTRLRNTYQSILNQYLPANQQQALTSGRLSNRKSQMDIDKAIVELAQQQELERQLRTALGGGNPAAMPQGGMPQGGMPQGAMPSAQPVGMPAQMPQAPQMPKSPQDMPMLPGMPKGLPMPPRVGGMTLIGSPPPAMQMPGVQTGAAAPNAPRNPTAAAATASQPEAMNETIVAKGSPQLAGIDAMYDSNPLSRAFLEKKGYKKTQEVKFDNKTGKTTIITKYPSGKVTVQASSGETPTADGIPLTNKMISKHQNVVASVDVATPILDQLIKMPDGDYSRWQTTNRGAKYNGMVNQVLDSVLGSFGLPSTDKGLESVLSQVQIGHFESPAAYRKRLKELKADLQKRKEYSSEQVKKSVKIMDDRSDNDTSSITDNDPLDFS